MFFGRFQSRSASVSDAIYLEIIATLYGTTVPILVAGICQAAQELQGDPETGSGYELDAIAMVVLGGTRLSGGSGGIGWTVIGVLTLGYLQKVLSLNAFSSELRLMLTGVILVLALLFQRKSAPP